MSVVRMCDVCYGRPGMRYAQVLVACDARPTADGNEEGLIVDVCHDCLGLVGPVDSGLSLQDLRHARLRALRARVGGPLSVVLGRGGEAKV